MATRGEMFAGLTVALVTPLKGTARSITTLFVKLVDWHVEQGTDCLAPVGTTGESPTLDHEEHERVIAAVVEQAARPHQGHARHRLQQHARGHPADASSPSRPAPTAPSWSARTTTSRRRKATTATSPPSPRRWTCRSCFTTSPAGPARTSCPKRSPASPSMPTIVAIKEATGSMDQASQIAALCDLTILSGDDSLTLPLMSIGGRGVVSVVGNIVPRDMKALVAAFDAGQDGRGAQTGTASCSRCAATCSAWRPTRSRSRRP